MKMLSIAGRELRGLFLSPVGWIVLAVIQLILGYMLLVQLELFSQWKPHLPNLPGAPGLTVLVVAPLLKTAGIVLLLASPLLTMRLVSEERRGGTLSLLLSAPVTMTEIVLGKFLGILAFFAIVLLIIALMPLALLTGGTLDFGLMASAYLGLFLLVASFAAAGLYLSTLTSQPAVAAFATFGLFLVLWVAGRGAAGGEGVGVLLAYLSLTGHLDAMLRGVVDTADIFFYLLFSTTFLALAIRRLDALRLGH
jgi:ABC-2 type transport system permease protein